MTVRSRGELGHPNFLQMMIIDKKVVLDDSLSIGQSHTLCHLAWLVGSYDFAQKMSKKVRQNSSGLPFPFLLNRENQISTKLFGVEKIMSRLGTKILKPSQMYMK